MAVEASPLFGVWHMTTVALFFVVGAVGVAFGYILGFIVGLLSRHRTTKPDSRLEALDRMMRVQKLIESGQLGTAARELGISDKEANTWTWQHLNSQIEVRLQALAKRAVE